MPQNATHRLVRRPKMTGRYLADYMTASERARRTIVRGCKYRPIAKIIQHDRAKNAVSRFLLEGQTDCDALTREAMSLRGHMADTPFDRDLLDNNADYIDAFAEAFDELALPNAERLRFDGSYRISLSGVQINPDIRFALQRVTRTNRLRTGLATLRYAKGKALPEETGLWQSSLLYGCRIAVDDDSNAEAEQQLCITIDAATGATYAAPGDALSRFRNMEAACQSIAERWDSIDPPDGAVIA